MMRRGLIALFIAGWACVVVPALAQDGAGARLPPEPAPAEPAPENSASDDSSSSEPVDDAASEAEDGDEVAAPPPNPFADAPREAVESSLSHALSDAEVSFCTAHESELLADPELCALSHLGVRQRCPALSQACRAQPQSQHSEWNSDRTLAGIAEVVFWLAVAAVIGFILLALRGMLGVGTTKASAPPVRVDLSDDEPERAPRPPGETDVARLWARAQELARAARFEEAIAAIQAALIHALRLSGKLAVTPAQTNGDHLRALRAEPDLQRTAREVFRAAESVQFGGKPASGEQYQTLLARVEPIVTRVVSVILLICACFTQLGCGNLGSQNPEADAHGLGVLTRLLTEQHTRVRRRIRPLNVIEPEVKAIVVLGEQADAEWSRLLRWASDGGTLIVTGSSRALALATNVHFVAHDYAGRLELPADFSATPLVLSGNVTHTLGLPAPSAPRERTFAMAEGRPYVASRSYGEGEVLFFADSELLQNASLSLGDNALFVFSLLQHPGAVVELVGPWTGGGADSTLSAFKNAGLFPLLAQLTLLALLFGWHGGVAFGKRRDPPLPRGRAFREHVLALGDNYRRAQATRFALAIYGAWLIERLRERLSFDQPIGLIELASRVAARSAGAESEAELVLLFTEARQAQEDVESASPSPADLSLLHKLEMLALRVGGSK